MPQFPFFAEIDAAQAMKAAVVVDVRMYIGTQTVYDNITLLMEDQSCKREC